MIEQLQTLLDAQRIRLQQLNRLGRVDRAADGLAMQVQELCDSLQCAIVTAAFLDTQKELESRLCAEETQPEAAEKQTESQKNPAGYFALTLSPRPEEQGRLALDQPRAIPPAPQYQGSMRDRYDIYVANAESLGWPIKSFDEWANS